MSASPEIWRGIDAFTWLRQSFFVFLACAVIGVMGYLMDNPGVLWGILGVAAVLFYITYAEPLVR